MEQSSPSSHHSSANGTAAINCANDRWSKRLLSQFTADLARLWVAYDPDALLLDELLLSELRGRGFEVMLYEDPFAFRAEYEERYRTAWDQGKQGPSPSLVLHVRTSDTNQLPWDIIHRARVVRLSLADLFPRLAYTVAQQVEPEHLARLFNAHETELQSVRGERESIDFVLEHVYQITPRSIRSPVDFWRELLRMHFADRSLPPMLAEHAADIIQGKEILAGQPVAEWLSSKNAFLRVVQDAWLRYLSTLGLKGRRTAEQIPPTYLMFDEVEPVRIPFDNTDVQALVDSMFLDGTLQPLAVHEVPSEIPSWIRTGIVQDAAAVQESVLNNIASLLETLPTAASPPKEWSGFARRYGDMLARFFALPGAASTDQLPAIGESIEALQAQADERLQEWIKAKHYANLILQSAAKGPVMLHHVPRFLRSRQLAGESKIALLVFDGLALDQWAQIREYLNASTQCFKFDEGTAFAWLPSVTSVSRQALFSGLKPREYEDSIERTDKEESLWKAFWQSEGVNRNEVIYQRALHQTHQLDALEAEIAHRQPKVVGLVIDEVDERLHKERSKKDVAFCIGNWLETGFVGQLFSMLLGKDYHIYLTADHGNVEATGIGRPNQGVIAETRCERVRIYRSEQLLADSANAYPSTVRLDAPGLPANFLPLFAGGRTAFVSAGEQVVVHGGASVEELIVPFVKISYEIGKK